MHIPDGFLDPLTASLLYLISLFFLYLSARRYFREGGDVYYLSVAAASIFAAQMLNWPIPGGTSAHLVGGALAAILIGPFGGCLAMFMNLLVQCLLMGDGGITALGANAFNMAIVDVFVGYAAYKALMRLTHNRFLSAFVGGWLGILTAALACGVEIGISSQLFSLNVTVPVMAVWHGLLGLVEGLITASIVVHLDRRGWFSRGHLP